MEDSGRRSPERVRVTRRLLILTWLWGVVSLLAIGGVLYHLFRARTSFLSKHSEGPGGE